MNLESTRTELRKAASNPWVVTPGILVAIVPAFFWGIVWAADQRYEKTGEAARQVNMEQYEYRQEILIWKESSEGLTAQEKAEKQILKRRIEKLRSQE